MNKIIDIFCKPFEHSVFWLFIAFLNIMLSLINHLSSFIDILNLIVGTLLVIFHLPTFIKNFK